MSNAVRTTPMPRPPAQSRRPPDLSGTPATLDEVMAGFISWLTRRDIPARRRASYHTHAERYLRWRASQPRWDAETAQRGYYTALRAQGASDTELDAARTSLVLLGSHLITHRPGWPRTPAATEEPHQDRVRPPRTTAAGTSRGVRLTRSVATSEQV